MKFEDFLIEKSLIEYSTEYTVTDDSVQNEKIATIFKIDDVTYAIQLYKTNKKGLWKVAIGSVPNTYIKLWKVNPQHLRIVMGTALKIIADAFDTIPPNLLAGIAVRLPDSAKPSHAKIAEMVVKTKYAPTMKFVNVVPSANDKVKEIYILIARKTANIAKVFRGKEFKGYDENMPDTSVAQDDLADAEAKRPLRLNRISRKPFEYKGYKVAIESDVADKVIGIENPNIIAKKTIEVQKKYDLPVGTYDEYVQTLMGKDKVISVENLFKLIIAIGSNVNRQEFKNIFDPTKSNEVNSNISDIFMSGRYAIEGNFKSFFPSLGINKEALRMNNYSFKADELMPINKMLEDLLKDTEKLKETFKSINAELEQTGDKVKKKLIATDPEEYTNKKLLEAAKDKDSVYYDEMGKKNYSVWNVIDIPVYFYVLKILADSQKLEPFEASYEKKGGYTKEEKEEILKIYVDVSKQLDTGKLYGKSLEEVTPNAVKMIKTIVDNYINKGIDNADSWELRKLFYYFAEDNDYKRRYELPVFETNEEEIDQKVEFNTYEELKGKSISEILGFDNPPHAVVIKGDEMLARLHNYAEFDRLNDIAGRAVYEYTSSAYGPMNDSLRGVLTKPDDLNEVSLYGLAASLKLIDAFDAAKPTEEDIVVFRGSRYPGIKDEVSMKSVFVDPGFLSTSSNIGTVLNFGGGSNGTRFMILVPKGAKVITANGSSSFPSEKEIILPAFSILKPLRMGLGNTVDGSKSRFVEVLYVGNGMTSYREKLLEVFKKKLESERMPLDTDYKSDTFTY